MKIFRKKNVSLLGKVGRLIKFLYFKIVRIKATPEVIARGLALGMFVGMTPTMGFQMAIGAFIATLFRQNILATVIVVWVTNPLTFIPIYTFNYTVGAWVLQLEGTKMLSPTTFTSIKELFKMGGQFVYTLWFGSIVVGIVMAVITYYVSVPFIGQFQHRRRERRRKKGSPASAVGS